MGHKPVDTLQQSHKERKSEWVREMREGLSVLRGGVVERWVCVSPLLEILPINSIL